MWDSERKFGEYIMSKLGRKGITPIRIESGPTTISRIPDLYVFGHNNDWFIELKNTWGKSIKDTHWSIPWRQGQRGWARQYSVNHTQLVPDRFVSTKYSWTFVGLDDGVLLIRMSNFESNKVFDDNYSVFKFTLDEFKKCDLHWFLRTHSQVVTPNLQEGMTWGNYIYLQMKLDIEEVIGNHYHNVNIPEPADIVDEIAPELADKLTTEISPYDWCDSKFMGWIQRKIAEKACLIYRHYLDNNN